MQVSGWDVTFSTSLSVSSKEAIQRQLARSRWSLHHSDGIHMGHYLTRSRLLVQTHRDLHGGVINVHGAEITAHPHTLAENHRHRHADKHPPTYFNRIYFQSASAGKWEQMSDPSSPNSKTILGALCSLFSAETKVWGQSRRMFLDVWLWSAAIKQPGCLFVYNHDTNLTPSIWHLHEQLMLNSRRATNQRFSI